MNTLNLTLDDLHRLEQLVIELSDDTLLPFLNNTHADLKDDGSIVTEADLAMQQALSDSLKSEFGEQVACLGEESDELTQQKIMSTESQFWVFDPLDGTTNFHASFPIFCISVAFIQHNEVKLGITYDPIRKECFSALKGHGFYFNQHKIEHPVYQGDNTKECIAFIDFKRLTISKSQQLVQNMPFKSQRNIGSSALEWAWLAMRRADLSFHGGQKLWDYAAGSLLLSEAGGYSQDLHGKTLYQNTIKVRPVLAASSKDLCQAWKKQVL